MPHVTKNKIFSLLPISTENEYRKCRAFLKDFLIENDLLGEQFLNKAGRERIKQSLTETLQTVDHSKVPRVILNASASSDGMRALLLFSRMINRVFRNQLWRRSHRSGDANLQVSLSVQVPHPKPLPEDCDIYVFNLAYQGHDAVTPVTEILKDGASQPITYQDLDFCRWKNILRGECGFDESLHSIACSLLVPPSPSPQYVVLQGGCSWQNAIMEMINAGKAHCVFWMERSEFEYDESMGDV
jgi:hypothetical protein